MRRRIIGWVVSVLVWLGLTQFLREISKTALYDWVLAQAKQVFAERWVDMIPLTATYAVPLVGSALLLAGVYVVAFRRGRATAGPKNADRVPSPSSRAESPPGRES